jgi:hypothetical protein
VKRVRLALVPLVIAGLSLPLAAAAQDPPPPPIGFRPSSEIKTLFRKCWGEAKGRTTKRACLAKRRERVGKFKRALRNLRFRVRRWAQRAKAERRACVRMKNKDALASLKQWRTDVDGWVKKFRVYATKGGEAPSAEPPSVPKNCRK